MPRILLIHLFPPFLFLSLLNFLHEVFLQLRQVHHVLLLVGLHPVVLHQAPIILYEGNVKKSGESEIMAL